ncbi:MAG: CRISPR-associated protein Cas4 [Anaerolineaceae bacterium]|nr:MAG: CRISPR-associated protein Cas4 [Anaerolineaceae bacterium]
MRDYKEEDYLLISGIQHFVFCRRQWALIHVEQQWEENFFTMDGILLHERADDYSIRESRKDIITIRALPIKSKSLCVTGKCDVVELKLSSDGVCLPKYDNTYKVYPVEYKRGKPKDDDSDNLQLLAQAICLEEMLMTAIDKAYMFYFETRRRQEVVFTEIMRKRLYDLVTEMHYYMDKGITPKVRISKKCKTCSLNNICMPKINEEKNVSLYIQRRIDE